MITELKVGRVYRAKRPKAIGVFERLINDRQIVWVGLFEVQYDGPAVAIGRHLPRISKEKFLAWAAEDVTDKLPDGEWEKA